MIVPCFVDTNVLVYAEDGHDPRKQALARDLIRRALTVRTATVSTQVLAEFFAVAVGRLRLTAESARRRVEIYCALNIFRIGSEDILAAIDLHRLTGLSIWDALIVRAAMATGCRALYTEDLQHGGRFGGVEVVNPFREETGG
ncbi:MAG: PIN domain-containing protein [Acidobacteriota bacterium]